MAAIIIKYKADNGGKYQVRGLPSTPTTDRVCTIGNRRGYTYLSIPSEHLDAYIPQPKEVEIDIVTVTPAVSADLCKWGAPFRAIDKRTKRTIREKYSIEDEFKSLRTNDTEYINFVENLVAEGKQKKLKILGLSQDDS